VTRIFYAALFYSLMIVADASAQTAAPTQPTQSEPTATFRTGTSVVLVPTLVEKHSGEVIYGLQSKDFVLEDNGVPQKIAVDEDMDTAPVALVVAVEQGRSSVLEFDKLAHLGPLLDLFLGDGQSKAALVSFDSLPHLVRDFTQDQESLSMDLRALTPGDGGAAILDTVGYAVDILDTMPKNYRRVLLLISESRDHGSRHVKPEDLVQRIGRSDVLVLSLTYSASKAEFTNDVKGGGNVGPTMNLLSPLLMAIQALRKNVPREIALMSGGEYAPFTKEKSFESHVDAVAKHARNRYLLSFHPSDATPGLHQLSVKLTEDYGAKLVARANYWAVDTAK
jgi:VWFA-related protein